MVGLVGCHHPAPPPPKGEAAFQILPPVQTSKEQATGNDYVIPPDPILPLATPVYPAKALGTARGAVTVGVRIDIDRKGAVADIQPSLRVFSSPNSFEPGFREAVEQAVRQWRFVPAKLQHAETVKGADGTDSLLMRDGGTTEWSIDVAFTFTASGDVLAGLPKK